MLEVTTNIIKTFEEFPDLCFGCFGHNLNLILKIRELTQQSLLPSSGPELLTELEDKSKLPSTRLRSMMW